MSKRQTLAAWLGEKGTPKICVPLTGDNPQTVLDQAAGAVLAHPDLIEWRADYMLSRNKTMVFQMASDLRKILGRIPLLFTVRTAEEGGLFDGTPDEYRQVILEAAYAGIPDLIDVEGFHPGAKELIKELKDLDICVITSRHNFSCTPPPREMMDIFDQLLETGADVLKQAVMPIEPGDVTNLMEVTRQYHERVQIPLISMAMGPLGRASRTEGESCGSCVTFASVGAASAPGQLRIDELRMELKKCHDLLRKSS